MVQECQPTELEKDDQRAQATAAVEVLQQYLQDQIQVQINLKKEQHNAQELHQQLRNQEIQTNADLIQNMANPQERGDLRCDANTGQVLESARAMHHINPVPILHGPSRTFLPSLPTIPSRPSYPSRESYPARKEKQMQMLKDRWTSPHQGPANANTNVTGEIVKTDG